MQVPEEMVVQINYQDSDIPATVREFKPALYRDGDSFCCLLGEDPQAGIFGCGESPKAAIEDWDSHFKERLQSHAEDDELVQYIEASRKFSKKKVQ